MVRRLTASLVFLLPLGCCSMAQDFFHQVILGDTIVSLTESLIVPNDEVWLLSELGPDCFVELSTSSGAAVSITGKMLDNDPNNVTVWFTPAIPEHIKEEVRIMTFFHSLPLFLPPSTRMKYGTGANQRIVFRVARR